MAIKNFSISGIGRDVQLGKKGGRLSFTSGVFAFTSDLGGTNYAPVIGGTPLQPEHLATKAYVDSISGGIKPLQSVSVSTQQSYTVDGNNTNPGTGATWAAGVFSDFPRTVDGHVLEMGSRVLVRLEGITITGDTPTVNDAGAARNGIYIVTNVDTENNTVTLDRAPDSDEDNEFIFGSYVLVENGTSAGDGYTLTAQYGGSEVTPPNQMNVDPQFWVKYTSAGATYTAGAGLALSDNEFSLSIPTLSDFTGTAADTLSLAVSNGTTNNKLTVNKLFTDLGVVTALGQTDGVIVKSGSSYVSRTIVADTTGNKLGIAVSNTDGSAGNITVGLDVNGLTAVSSALNDTDVLPIYDGTSNKKVSISQLAAEFTSGFSSNSISQLDSSVVVTDTGSNGTITFTADNTAVATITSAGLTSSNLTASNLTSGRIVLAGTSGHLEDNSALTFSAGILNVGSLTVDSATSTISTTETNGNIIIAPNGTGEVVIQGNGNAEISAELGEQLSLRGDGVIIGNTANTVDYITATETNTIFYSTLANNIAIAGAAASSNPSITALGSDTNLGLNLGVKGTGKIVVTGVTASAYSSGLTDASLVNKLYVDTAVSSASSNITALQTEVNAIETSVGLNTDGTLSAYTGTNYLDSAISIRQATTLLDAQVKTNADDILDKADQTEVDAIETAVGLGTDGTLAPYTGTNYLNSATSIKQATILLDTQIKSNEDDIALKANQTEVDAIETGAGLNTDGTYTADATTNYITTATSLANADKLLDAQIKINTDAIAQLGSAAGSVRTVTLENIPFDTDSSTPIIEGTDLPANGIIINSIIFKVNTAADTAAWATVTHNSVTLASDTTNDPEVAGLYQVDVFSNSVAGQDITLTIAAHGASTGTVTVLLQYTIL
ncbi:hypothetical protein RVBP17_2160 [Pseudomonas phage sp. 30-3]|nr:hypothetical protein RVBP17_2160 [Pseudomonas phage sp. 30-3]